MESQRFGVNASYVESIRAQWLLDPSSVAEEWRRYSQDDLAARIEQRLADIDAGRAKLIDSRDALVQGRANLRRRP